MRYLRAYTLLHRIVPAFTGMPAPPADGATKADRSRA